MNAIRWFYLWLAIGMGWLAGCGQAAGPSSAAPPTPAATNTAVASVPSSIPPTWTPQPSVTPAAPTLIAALPVVGRALTATAQPTVPTNTPVPPTATPAAPETAAPTPTRYVSFIPDLPPSAALGPSKLGLHVNRPNTPAIMEFVRAAQPAVMKGVADLGWLADVKRESPRTITIARIPVEDQNYAGDPEEAARRMVAEQLEEYLLHPWVDYWEGWNEPDPGLERMEWYARFEQERVRLLASYGLRAAVGGFSTGVPEMDEFALFIPAVATAQQHRGILSLHEYAAPDITFLFGDPLPGYPAYPDRGSLMFRYRWYYRDILEPAGLAIPLVISEAGIDGLAAAGYRPGPPGQGWQDFQEYWVEQGWGQTGVEAFIRQLNWYDNGVRQDGYVIGFCIFTAGGAERWVSYDVNPILPELAAYVVSQQ